MAPEVPAAPDVPGVDGDEGEWPGVGVADPVTSAGDLAGDEVDGVVAAEDVGEEGGAWAESGFFPQATTLSKMAMGRKRLMFILLFRRRTDLLKGDDIVGARVTLID